MVSLSGTGVYAIESSGSRVYIGSTTMPFAKRVWDHFYRLSQGIHHSPGLQEHFNTHGKSGLEVKILERVPRLSGESQKAFRRRLFDREQYWLDAVNESIKLNTHPKANSPEGTRLRQEHRAKISRSLKRHYSDPANRERLRSTLLSPSAIAKVSETRRKKWHDPVYRATQLAKFRADTTTPEARAKNSQASTRRNRDPDYQARRVATFKQTASTPEFKARMSAAAKEVWSRPGHKDHYSIDKQASRRKPTILIAPDGVQYVTDTVLQFAKQFGLNQGNLSAVTRGAVPHHRNWTGYRLQSWSEVPADAIQVLWGEHADLPQYSGVSP